LTRARKPFLSSVPGITESTNKRDEKSKKKNERDETETGLEERERLVCRGRLRQPTSSTVAGSQPSFAAGRSHPTGSSSNSTRRRAGAAARVGGQRQARATARVGGRRRVGTAARRSGVGPGATANSHRAGRDWLA